MKTSRNNLRLGTAAAASLLYALPVEAQTMRDGAVEQAIQDTIAANLKRRGYADSDPKVVATRDAVRQAITDATSSGATSTGVVEADRTWAETIRGLLSDIASGFTWPLPIGKSNTFPVSGGGGNFGGGGATGTWDESCDDIKVDFDAQGYFIVPSYSLKVGQNIVFTGFGGVAGFRVQGRERASSNEAVARWWMHRINAGRIPQRWYGVIGTKMNSTGTLLEIDFATVAYRDENNVVVGRETNTLLPAPFALVNGMSHGSSNPRTTADIQCPQAPASGGDFHFYGHGALDGTDWSGDHNHSCTMYAPNPELGEGGYFINRKATIVLKGTTFPKYLGTGYRQCATDPSFIKRLADALAKKAANGAGYAGAPYSPIADEDARPNDTTIEDLKDNPTTGTRPNPNPVNVDTPPTPPPSGTPPPSPPSTGVDLGPDPNIGTPSDPDAPTNIMDPVFDWLPDLPNIQLNTAGAPCPTWEMQPFQGPEWHLVMDKHCPFIADNAALISTIMILGFTVGSAMIILRA